MERQPEEPRERHHDYENHQGDQADLERMRRIDRFELHQFSDRVLPLRRPPEIEDRDDRAADGRGELEDPPETALRLGEFHVCPEPAAEYAHAVSGRE